VIFAIIVMTRLSTGQEQLATLRATAPANKIVVPVTGVHSLMWVIHRRTFGLFRTLII
jgi:hypothetical protein